MRSLRFIIWIRVGARIFAEKKGKNACLLQEKEK